MKILIVDDKEENLYFLESLLKGNGFNVKTASNGQLAFDQLYSSQFDLIISDILMPVMDGFELCRRVKKDEKLKDIPFVFYTATYTEKKDEEFALGLGASKFLIKPQEPEDFLRIIKNIIKDTESGKVKSESVYLNEDKEIFKLYNERLIKKLEKKMLDLEREVTAHKKAEEQIAASLKEKEVLLREIHHRVKNNMQVIVSLLRMHSRRTKDKQAGQVFDDCRDRVNAMSLIHEALYQSDNLSRIDFEVYLKKLYRNLEQTYGASDKGIAVTVKKCSVSLNIDQGVAIGMVISELVSNAFKHAFPLGKRGDISISLIGLEDDNVELIIMDNGKGLPPEIDILNSSSLGLKLAAAAVTRELGGNFEVERDHGTKYLIRFKGKSS